MGYVRIDSNMNNNNNKYIHTPGVYIYIYILYIYVNLYIYVYIYIYVCIYILTKKHIKKNTFQNGLMMIPQDGYTIQLFAMAYIVPKKNIDMYFEDCSST